MEDGQTITCDALVAGGGIAGLQSALDLADQDFSVVIIEKDLSIGGKMIRLSKVFPTLDCSNCITTPTMASAAHHENITIYTWCTLKQLNENQGMIRARVTQKPRYVDQDKCIGCRKCEYECPVYIPDHEQGGFCATKAVRIPFSNAIPQVAALDPENCMLCGKCEKVCPTGAIDYFQKPFDFVIEAKTAILCTGFEMTTIEGKPQYGNGKVPNVVTALQMERLLAPHGPYNRMLRPSDGMEPDSIAFVQCAGSRDKSMGVPYCSRFCCMYAIKQAMLLSGALPLADIYIYYMDIRAFGKGYEQFYQTAKAMGIQFIKGKVGRIEGAENGSVAVRFEAQGGSGVTTENHDLVVLSLGVLPDWSPEGVCSISTTDDRFIQTVQPSIGPTLTSRKGIFVAGAAAGPKDIVDSISEAGAAAMEASNSIIAHGR